MQIESIDQNIWLADGENVSFYGFAYPTRSVIVRLPGETLWIWSPIALTPELRGEIEALGAVGYLVSQSSLSQGLESRFSQGVPLGASINDRKAARPRLSTGPQRRASSRVGRGDRSGMAPGIALPG